MKYKLSLVVTFIAFSCAVGAQTNERVESKSKKKVFVKVQLADRFPEEAKAFAKYLATHIDTSLPDLITAPVGKNSVKLSYSIGVDGAIKDIVTKKNPGYGTAEEVVRVMKSYLGNKPLMKDGKPVEFHGKLSVQFTVLDESEVKDSVDEVLSGLLVGAEFPGGPTGWRMYIERNLNSNIPTEKGAPAGKYTIKLNFFVGKDGSVNNIVAENNPGYGTVEECIRVMRRSPKWIPAECDGQKVKDRVYQVMTFIVSQ